VGQRSDSKAHLSCQSILGTSFVNISLDSIVDRCCEHCGLLCARPWPCP
jgi:hypothetical protein